MDILENVGVVFRDDIALEDWRKAGAKVDGILVKAAGHGRLGRDKKGDGIAGERQHPFVAFLRCGQLQVGGKQVVGLVGFGRKDIAARAAI